MATSTAQAILRDIRSEGYSVSTVRDLERKTVTLTAWETSGEIIESVRPPDAEVWEATAPTLYRAAFELATMLGWELDD